MIYADYNGSAPLCEEVVQYLQKRIVSGPFANPNAIHHLGQKVLMGMENARSTCAKAIGAIPKQIIFNSGSTEGISQVFFSLLHGRPNQDKDVLIISGIEHSAVINCARFYEKDQGYKLEIIPTLKNGLIDINALTDLVQKYEGRIALIAAMAANNETGVIQPYNEIGEIAAASGAKYLSDTTQLIGKAPFHFNNSKIDFAFLSGHKIGAMTGCGFLLAKDPTTLRSFVIGGGQENDLRGGTQNYLGYETIAVALDAVSKKSDKLEKLKNSRIAFENKIKEEFKDVVIMGEEAPRVAGTTFVSLPGVHGQAVQIELESQGIYVTTSSACSDNEPTTSKVLKAMKVGDDVGRGAVRISLGTCSKEGSYDEIFKALASAYRKLSKIKSY